MSTVTTRSVEQVLAGLADGSITIEQAEQDFASRKWNAPPRAANVEADPEPEPAGSFMDVAVARSAGRIDAATYDRLAAAAAKSH